jgi:hypothetical protein
MGGQQARQVTAFVKRQMNELTSPIAAYKAIITSSSVRFAFSGRVAMSPNGRSSRSHPHTSVSTNSYEGCRLKIARYSLQCCKWKGMERFSTSLRL